MGNMSRCSTKRKGSPYHEDKNNGDSEQDTSIAEMKRAKNGSSVTGQETAGTNVPVHILDLPIELLAKIFRFTGTYKEIAALRAVCRRFDTVCCHLLLHGL